VPTCDGRETSQNLAKPRRRAKQIGSLQHEQAASTGRPIRKDLQAPRVRVGVRPECGDRPRTPVARQPV